MCICFRNNSCFVCFAVSERSNTPAVHPFRRPLSQFNSPVFVSDSDDDDDEDSVVIRSSWKTRHSKPKSHLKANKNDEENRSPLLPADPFPPIKTQELAVSPKRTFSMPAALYESGSSEEEFVSLLERLKRKNTLISTSFTPKTTKGKVSDEL